MNRRQFIKRGALLVPAAMAHSSVMAQLNPFDRALLGQGMPVAPVPAPTDYIFHVPLNENTGTTIHETVNAYTATLQGTASWATGRKGTDVSLAFDGSSNYIPFGTTAAINNWTALSISMWFKVNTVGGNAAQFTRLLEKGANSEITISYNFTSGDNKIGFQHLGSSSLMYESANTFNDGNWHHLVMAISGTYFVDTYFDGGNHQSNQEGAPSKTNNLTMGYYGGFSGPYFWKGWMQDLQIFNRVLSAAEVSAIFNS